MAESPLVLEAFTALRSIWGKGTLSPVEREVIALTVSFDNDCSYCMAAHSTFAAMNGIAEDDLTKLRAGQQPSASRLHAISDLAREVVRRKGHLSAEEIRAFLQAGFSRAQLLEVLVGINMATIANYTHNIANTPVDEAFKAQSWTNDSAGAPRRRDT
jgi:AhpD family alkylhydroperoxidase